MFDELVVGPAGEALFEGSSQTVVGQPGFKKERWLYALPLENGPQLLQPYGLIVDPQGNALADASGVLVGQPRLYVSRMLAAAPVEATR